ncbi:hypothetical protein GWA97_01520 [Flavobacterium sp. LaA7.5]|nr:hypothetical protein [Flavobacterium salilacus subsp. altitudinum]
MNLIEREVEDFIFELRAITVSLSNIKNEISSKLLDFNRDSDKLEFLSVARKNISEERIKHEKQCTGCSKSQDYETILFCLEQEYDDIKKYFKYEVPDENQFSTLEEINIITKLNEVLENLSELRMGQEVIFNEIDDLKQHFNLGKKNWFDLLKGKLISLCAEKVIEEAIAKKVYNSLAKEVSSITNYIETQL